MSDENLPLIIPSPLSSLVPELPQLAALLTCSICYELQVHSTSTPCLHTFCSFCIRKYLQFKPNCPTCHATVYEQNLRSDKTGENVVLLIRPLVQSLEKLIANKDVKKVEHVSNDLANKDVKKVELVSNDQKENQQPFNHIFPTDTNLLHKSATLPLSPVKTESTNIVNTVPKLPTLKVKEESQLLIQPTQPSNRTPCPVCNVPIPDRTINLHVEKCLSTRKATPIIQPVKKRAALPKLVYALLKDSELKKKCKEFGLNPKGDRKSLINRLQKYTLLYNTESQLDKPRSKMVIVMQVEREEKEEKAGKFSTPALLQFDRKTESEVIEQKQKQYMKENKESFADMIKQVKARNKKKKNVETEATSDGFNLIATVENIEDVSGAIDQRRSIEDLTEAEFSEPIFDLPGPSKVSNAPAKHVSPKSDIIQTTAKRSLSPTFPPSSPPRKQPRSSSKAVLYITPKKSELEELARSPMKSQSIFDRMTASSEQMRKFPKIPCPVCNVGVTEKFLNIHLDKCLKTGEEPSPVFTRTKQKRKSQVKSVKPSVQEHLARIVIDDSEDSEASLVLNFSDCEDEVFSKQHVPPRDKHARRVVKPSIIETSDDPEVIETDKSGTGSTNTKHYVEKEGDERDLGEEVSKDPLDDTIWPPSPVYEQYTDTISQSSYVQSQVAGVGSDPDMFASGSEAEFVSGIDDLDSSRNLLEIEDDIEIMMEAALSEDEENEAEVEEKNQPEKSRKRTVIKIVPTQKEERASNESTIGTQPTQSKTPEPKPEATLVRSTRRTTRLRSKAKLI